LYSALRWQSCHEISSWGSIVIATIISLFVLAVISAVYYWYHLRVVDTTLDKLKQGLLEPDSHTQGHGGSGGGGMHEYLQAIKQELYLRDVLINKDDLTLERRVGEGTFGVVYKAQWRGAAVAVKMIKVPTYAYCDLQEEELDRFRQEAYLMSRLRHPNIALIMGICMLQGGNASAPRRTMCIVTEFLSRGERSILMGPHPSLRGILLMVDCPRLYPQGVLRTLSTTLPSRYRRHHHHHRSRRASHCLPACGRTSGC
jgi:hypothetical protein